jgi:hypothetical protein
MSADNWDICPRCREYAAMEYKEKQRKVDEEYGKIPKEEYLDLIYELEHPQKLEYTLREGYEIGFSGFQFYVRYEATCRVCGFSHTHKYEETVPR